MRISAPACILSILIVLQVFTACERKQQQLSAEEILRTDIEWLAHEERQGRLAGTLHEADAANYISDRFLQAGLEPFGENGTYLQQYILEGPVTQALGIENTISRNIAGVVRGQTYPERVIVVGAHYDGQGTGGVISLNPGTEELLHPSADDNASGTAGLLYLAKYFAENPASVSVLFVAFSGEEPGLLGSKHFVANYDQLDSVLAMINLDMIGRMEDRTFTLFGTSTSSVWPAILNRIQKDGFEVNQPANVPENSDHAPFLKADIPVLHYHTGIHKDYHRESDTVDKLNYRGMVQLLGHAGRVIRELADTDPQEIDFIGVSEQPRHFFNREGALLGVLPDYNFRGEGFRINKVSEDGLAKKHGLIDGDIIAELSGKPIATLNDYMEALNEIKLGQVVHVVYIRDDKRERVAVQF